VACQADHQGDGWASGDAAACMYRLPVNGSDGSRSWSLARRRWRSQAMGADSSLGALASSYRSIKHLGILQLMTHLDTIDRATGVFYQRA